METLKLEKTTAIKIFKKASKEIQEILISSFGPECFSRNIIDRIKTYNDAWEEADQKTREEYEILPTDTNFIVAVKKLALIAEVLSEGWTPDWNNSSQKKWYPFFNLSSGFGFSPSDFNSTLTNACVGSRLCFEKEEKATYAGKQFIEIYKDFLT